MSPKQQNNNRKSNNKGVGNKYCYYSILLKLDILLSYFQYIFFHLLDELLDINWCHTPVRSQIAQCCHLRKLIFHVYNCHQEEFVLFSSVSWPVLAIQIISHNFFVGASI